ncbi:MAG: cytochrome c-type biogenesis protein [Acidimicrobiia bacterium]|jgi:cytochrome c-type biogenesis protein CcmH
MSDRTRRIVGWGLAIGAIAVMVVGLLPKPAAADPEQRAQSLEQRLACPLCHGQSLAESGSDAAADLKVIIREKIDAGLTDDQILDYFAVRYGDHIVLEPPLLGWGLALWAAPLVAFGVGGWIVWTRRGVVS